MGARVNTSGASPSLHAVVTRSRIDLHWYDRLMGDSGGIASFFRRLFAPAVGQPAVSRPAVSRPAVSRPAVSQPAVERRKIETGSTPVSLSVPGSAVS
jgi:hypothetical protein